VLNGKRRVVITGLGAVSPIGLSMPEMWQSLLAGKSGIDYITSFDATPFAVKSLLR
jgi:3-oxoacyl-[acyl-carrier-protein] synthase II